MSNVNLNKINIEEEEKKAESNSLDCLSEIHGDITFKPDEESG